MSEIKERTCIVCGKKDVKQNLLRWVLFNNKIHPDWTQKLPGRSVYSHLENSCVEGIYDKNRVLKKIQQMELSYAVEREKIFDHIYSLSHSSLAHFFSLGKKSGVLFKGQNLLEDCIKKGKDNFKVCFTASDIAERTLKNMEKLFGQRLVKTKLSKDEMGFLVDRSVVGTVAFTKSEITERVCFYMNLINKLRSGDIDAH